MTSKRLENLARTGDLKPDSSSASELASLLRSALARLSDAGNPDLAIESRFDLAYNAAHALALHAIRTKGYRTDRRYLVFQLLEVTAGLAPEHWRVLAEAHRRRNVIEYEGTDFDDERLLADMIEVAELLAAALKN